MWIRRCGVGSLASAAAGSCRSSTEPSDTASLFSFETILFCYILFPICSKFLAISLCRNANRWFRMSWLSWLMWMPSLP